MKKVVLLIVLMLLTGILAFPQFSVRSKVEVQLVYLDTPIQKPLSLELISADNDMGLGSDMNLDSEVEPAHSNPIIGSQWNYIFYDVVPGKYYLGLDFPERMVLMDVLVGFDIDDNGVVTTSYSVPNEIEVHKNRNLKIELRFENGDSSSGFQKNIEEHCSDYDYVGMTFFFASLEPVIDVINGDGFNIVPDVNRQPFIEKSRVMARASRIRNTLFFQQYHISQKSYMEYFTDCQYCRFSGSTGPETYNGVDCTYLSIPKFKVYYHLKSIKHAPFGSPDAKAFGLGPRRPGANKYTIYVHKESLKCVALSCLKIDKKCMCKFECTPNLIVHADIRYFKCADLRMIGDKVKIPYLDERGKEEIETYDYYESDCACSSFEEAIKEHEILHCAQYHRQMKDLFDGGGAADILNKVCKKIKKFNCKGDISVCENKVGVVKSQFRKLMTKYFSNYLAKRSGQRETEAHDYMFQVYNREYKNCTSSK